MPDTTKVPTLESLPLEELLEELQKYSAGLWKKLEDKNFSLRRAESTSESKKSWCEYLLALGPYLIVLRKEILKQKYPLDVYSPEKRYVYSDIPKSFRLEILFNWAPAKVFEEGITSRKYRTYRQLERFFDGLGTPRKNLAERFI